MSMPETEIEAKRRVNNAIEAKTTIVDPTHSKDEAGFSMKARLYIYVHARRTGALSGGALRPNNPTDCADAIIFSHAAGRKWETNKSQIAGFINRPILKSASATGTDGIPSPFNAGGSERPLHTLSGDEGKRACSRFLTSDGYVVRRLADVKPETLKSHSGMGQADEERLDVNAKLPEEVVDTDNLIEGSVRQITVNAYERNARARTKCIEAHGTTCCICKFNFGEMYGPIADGYIHVHHIKPLSEIQEQYIVNPVEDLRPVCPNCHAVLHLNSECRSIEEVANLLRLRR